MYSVMSSDWSVARVIATCQLEALVFWWNLVLVPENSSQFSELAVVLGYDKNKI